MTEKNGSGKREEPKFDGVVDELRNVLSGLSRPAEPKPAAPPFSADPGPFAENGRSNAATNGKANGNGNGVAKPVPPSEPLASDADFWNGNVLGWPSNADADLPDVPAVSTSSTEPAPQDNQFFREDTGGNGFGALTETPMPEPMGAEPMMSAGEMEADRFLAGDAGKDFTPPVPEPIENTPEAWPLTKDADELVPAAPAAPSPMAAPSKPMTPVADPWLHPALDAGGFAEEPPPPVVRPAPVVPAPVSAFDPPSPTPSPVTSPSPFEPLMSEPPPAAVEKAPAASPATAFRPSADFEFELPIPGTKETKDKPAEDGGPHLDLEGTEMKPHDLVQIACLFPEGQEKAGQAFVTKLRDAAEKLRAPITLKAVFVSAWTPDKIDVAAWAKSAQLSGADSLFVLSFRASAKLFSNLVEVAGKAGPKARLVLLEQTGFPTLYADILVELRRAR